MQRLVQADKTVRELSDGVRSQAVARLPFRGYEQESGVPKVGTWSDDDNNVIPSIRMGGD